MKKSRKVVLTLELETALTLKELKQSFKELQENSKKTPAVICQFQLNVVKAAK